MAPENIRISGDEEYQHRQDYHRGDGHDPDPQFRPGGFAFGRHSSAPHKLRHVLVSRGFEFSLAALEDQAPFIEHHELCTCIPSSSVTRNRIEPSALAIVSKIRHQLPVLGTLRHNEIRGV